MKLFVIPPASFYKQEADQDRSPIIKSDFVKLALDPSNEVIGDIPPELLKSLEFIASFGDSPCPFVLKEGKVIDTRKSVNSEKKAQQDNPQTQCTPTITEAQPSVSRHHIALSHSAYVALSRYQLLSLSSGEPKQSFSALIERVFTNLNNQF